MLEVSIAMQNAKRSSLAALPNQKVANDVPYKNDQSIVLFIADSKDTLIQSSNSVHLDLKLES